MASNTTTNTDDIISNDLFFSNTCLSNSIGCSFTRKENMLAIRRLSRESIAPLYRLVALQQEEV